MLVGKGVGEFVNQDEALGDLRGAFEEEHFLLAVVVEGGGLLGEEVDGGCFEIVGFGDESEELEGQLFDADLFRFHRFINTGLEENLQFFAGDEVAFDLGFGCKAGEGGELVEGGVDLIEQVLVRRLGVSGREEEEDGDYWAEHS